MNAQQLMDGYMLRYRRNEWDFGLNGLKYCGRSVSSGNKNACCVWLQIAKCLVELSQSASFTIHISHGKQPIGKDAKSLATVTYLLYRRIDWQPQMLP